MCWDHHPFWLFAAKEFVTGFDKKKGENSIRLSLDTRTMVETVHISQFPIPIGQDICQNIASIGAFKKNYVYHIVRHFSSFTKIIYNLAFLTINDN